MKMMKMLSLYDAVKAVAMLLDDPNGTGMVWSSDVINNLACAPSVEEIEPAQKWISVEDRLPAETHSIFWPLYGRKNWSNAMWREESDKVLVTVTFKDGTRRVTTGETHDGEWHTTISKALNPIVTHWMPMPEPPKKGGL